MRRFCFVAVVFLVGTLTVGVTPASAYSTYGWWSRTEGGFTYCTDHTVSEHTNWDSLINQSITEYNGLNYTNPVFTRGPGCGYAHKIDFLAAPQDYGCGRTTSSTDSRGHINSIRHIVYTSVRAYWDGVNTTGGCNFRWTTLHEYGHAQGLGHACLASSVMYRNDNAKTTLQADDKAGMRWIYDAAFYGPPAPDNPPCN